MVLKVCSSILALGIVFFCIYIFFLKKQMKQMKEELRKTRNASYNRQLQITLMDSDLENLAAEINRNLSYQKQLKLLEEQKERKLRQSVSDIAHDLRTPLTVIKGNLQRMEQNDRLTKQEQNYLNICLDQTEVLKNMVDDFFELSVLESDSTPVELKEVDLTNLLVQFIVEHEMLIRHHHLEPQISLPEKSIKVLAQEQMLLRIFSNLLNNVIKYARNSFQIKMEQVVQGNIAYCQITFENEMSREEHLDVESLFERTDRGNQAKAERGAGLGLYIIKLLAEKRNAQVFAAKEKDQFQIGIRFPVVEKQQFKQ